MLVNIFDNMIIEDKATLYKCSDSNSVKHRHLYAEFYIIYVNNP